jgi:hypothetical protein
MSTDNQPQETENRAERTIRTDWNDYDYPGTAVVERVSDVTERDVTDLPPLQSTVDVDAHETLLTSAGGETVQITFNYAGLRITVRSDRSMLLRVPTGSAV